MAIHKFIHNYGPSFRTGAIDWMAVRGTLPQMKVGSDIELILQKPFSLLLPNYGY